MATHGILGCYTLQSDPALKVGKPRPERSRSLFGVTQRDLGHTAFTSVKAQCANRVEWLICYRFSTWVTRFATEDHSNQGESRNSKEQLWKR